MIIITANHPDKVSAEIAFSAERVHFRVIDRQFDSPDDMYRCLVGCLKRGVTVYAVPDVTLRWLQRDTTVSPNAKQFAISCL